MHSNVSPVKDLDFTLFAEEHHADVTEHNEWVIKPLGGPGPIVRDFLTSDYVFRNPSEMATVNAMVANRDLEVRDATGVTVAARQPFLPEDPADRDPAYTARDAARDEASSRKSVEEIEMEKQEAEATLMAEMMEALTESSVSYLFIHLICCIFVMI